MRAVDLCDVCGTVGGMVASCDVRPLTRPDITLSTMVRDRNGVVLAWRAKRLIGDGDCGRYTMGRRGTRFATPIS